MDCAALTCTANGEEIAARQSADLDDRRRTGPNDSFPISAAIR